MHFRYPRLCLEVPKKQEVERPKENQVEIHLVVMGLRQHQWGMFNRILDFGLDLNRGADWSLKRYKC